MTSAASQDRLPGQRATKVAILALVVATFATFWPALGADFQQHWDDNYNLTIHDRWRGLSGEHLGWMFTTFRLGHWIPLTWITFGIDHALWGMDARGYHLTNVLLHALNAVLFLFVCRAALRAAGSSAATSVIPAFAAALVFAVHPLRVESVAWITERRDVLSSAFLLLTVLAWLRYRETDERRFYLLAIAAYVPALLSKAWGITLPAVLLILDVWPHARMTRATLVRLVAEKLPFILLAIPTAILGFLAQRASGAMNYAEDFGPIEKVAQACYGLCFYVRETVWPTGYPIYSLDTALDPFEPRFLASILAVVIAGAAAFALRRRVPALAAALAIYAIVVAPVLGLTQSGIQLVADRYSYLSTLPFLVLAAAGLGRLAAGRALLLACGVSALFAYRAFDYAGVWHDSKSLFTYASERRPQEWFPWSQLGTMAFQEGNPKRADELYSQAIDLDERAWSAYENRGIARLALGQRDEAIADWTRAIDLYKHSPISFVNRGGLRLQDGDFASAREDLETAVAIDDDSDGTWLMLGIARLGLGERDAGRAAIERAVELAEPGSPVALEAQRRLDQTP